MGEVEYKPDDLRLVMSGGTGRTFVVIYERESYRDLARALFDTLSTQTRALLIESDTISDYNWSALTDSLRGVLERESVRQASFVGFAASASLVLNYALRDLKPVRTLVLVDAATRPHPSRVARMVDRLERFLPLGLPLRALHAGFDAASFLQRLRCPVLLLTTKRATAYLRAQASLFRDRLPTAWRHELVHDAAQEVHDLNQRLLAFQDVPAKCPQKNAA